MSNNLRNLLFVLCLCAISLLIVWPWGGYTGDAHAPDTRNDARARHAVIFGKPAFLASPKPRGRGIVNAAALENFFRALAQSRSRPVRVLHYGDSHVAADILTAFIRNSLQSDFGDGGAGYLTPANPFSTQRRNVTTRASNGWTFDGIGRRESARDGFYGLAGISLSAERAGETLTLNAPGRHYEIFYLQRPGGGRFSVHTDGPDVDIATQAEVPTPGYYAFVGAGAGAHDVEIRTLDDKPVRILGVVAERTAGVVYDVLGLNGARLRRWEDWSSLLLADNLRRRQPALVVLAYGTNEVSDTDWTPENYTRLLANVIRRVRQAVPEASVLVIGPPERADKELAAERLPALIAAQRRAAEANGAAFWSAYDAMGGAGTLENWVAAKWAQPDRIHFSRNGYQRLGALFYEDLRAAYQPRQKSSRRLFSAE